MLSLTHAGSSYRTKLLTQELAERFARCLARNPRFTDVHTQESSRSRGRFFVSYKPVSQARQADMLQQHQTDRLTRALMEGDGYTFVLDKDGGRPFFWCLSTSGEVYEVSEHTCTCPDFTYRCKSVSLKCKHQLALTQGQGVVATW